MKNPALIVVALVCCGVQASFAADAPAPDGTATQATAPPSDAKHARIERSPLRAARAANPNLPPLATRLSAGRYSAMEAASAAAAAEHPAPSEPQKLYSNHATDGYAH